MTKTIALTGLILLFLCAAASAEFGELRTPDRELTVRATRDRKAAAVRTLKPGELVRVGVEKDGWVAVFEPDEQKGDLRKAIGYANGKYLLPVKEAPAKPAAPAAPAAQAAPAAPAAPAEIKYAERRLEIRQARTTQSPSLGVLKQGEAVQAAFPRDGWYAVFRPNAPVRAETEALGFVPIAALLPKSVADLSEAAAPFKEQGPGAPVLPGTRELIPGGAEARFPVQPVGAKPAADRPKLPPALAAPQEPPRPEAQAPIAPPPATPVPPSVEKLAKNALKINADKMTYSEAENIVAFSGNVHAVHAQLVIDANKLSAYLSSGSKKGGEAVEKIEKIVAEGNVRMQRGNTEGYCTHATYFVKDGTLRMEGDPMVKDGLNTVKGETILFYVKENRSEVLGGKKRVEAIFYSTKDQAKP